MQLCRAAERAHLARVILDLILTVHHGRFPLGRRSTNGEIELLLIVCVVFIGHASAHLRTAAEVGRAIGIPRITARRKLQKLVRMGMLKREGKRYAIVDPKPKSFGYVDEAFAILRRASKRSF